jgi:hypothetical protein
MATSKKRRRKRVTMLVTVTVNQALTAAEARREVRSLINHQAGWLDFVPTTGEEVLVRCLAVVSAPGPSK